MKVVFAANNGAIGGGEVMLLQMAEAARSLGVDVHVVGPSTPGELVTAAAAAGFPTTALRGRSRARYALSLAAWARRHRRGLLWCNGLVPALATAGIGNRVVHLHQVPLGRQTTAATVARQRARLVVVPSQTMAESIRDCVVLANWTRPVAATTRDRSATARPARLGFIGRHSTDKGLDVLADAVRLLLERSPGSVELRLAGDDRFVPPDQADRVRQALDRVAASTVAVGWVDPVEFLHSVDLAVFPSTWNEPFGLVVAESMAAGTPFVISDAGALHEVAGSAHPWVARAGDAADLARVIEAALGTESSQTTMAARDRWERCFSPAAGEARFAALLDRLAVPHSAPTPPEGGS